MRLYHFPFSSNARRARLGAAHLGVAVEEIVVDLGKGEHKTPEFLALNPNGRVPVLVDGALTLTESNAILIYLAEKTPGQTVYPADVAARADVNRWMFWSAQHFAPAVGVLNYERFVKTYFKVPADPQEEARGERLFAECARVLDAHLAGKEWVAQGRLTLADLSLGAVLMSAGTARLDLGSYPNLRAWFERVQAMDAWKKTAP